MNKGKIYTVAILLAFCLNFVWESWHAVYLYKGFDPLPNIHAQTLRDFVHLMTYVATVDALMITLMLLGGALFWKQWLWFVPFDYIKVIYSIGVTLCFAIVVEYKALYLFHQWSYTETMPILLGLGLSPLLQLPVTAMMSMMILSAMTRYKDTGQYD